MHFSQERYLVLRSRGSHWGDMRVTTCMSVTIMVLSRCTMLGIEYMVLFV
jgi:hypothetical protein